METMGSVFFHLCCQTCPGWGPWAARMWLVVRFLEEELRLAGSSCLAGAPCLGEGWLDELKLPFSAPCHQSLN